MKNFSLFFGNAKLLRFMSLCLMTSAVLFGFTSCSDDDDDEVETVAGSSNGGSGSDEVSNSSDDDSLDSLDANGHAYVDLGLSVMWATMNVGASSETDGGDFYSWGDIETKTSYTSDNTPTYGVEMEDISGNAAYDVARALWGGSWRIPTRDEMDELIDECTWTYFAEDSVYGYEILGPNGNSIFLPINGYYNSGIWFSQTSHGAYWLSTPYDGGNHYYAINLAMNSSRHVTENALRFHGHSVRPVIK